MSMQALNGRETILVAGNGPHQVSAPLAVIRDGASYVKMVAALRDPLSMTGTPSAVYIRDLPSTENLGGATVKGPGIEDGTTVVIVVVPAVAASETVPGQAGVVMISRAAAETPSAPASLEFSWPSPVIEMRSQYLILRARWPLSAVERHKRALARKAVEKHKDAPIPEREWRNTATGTVEVHTADWTPTPGPSDEWELLPVATPIAGDQAPSAERDDGPVKA